MPVTDRGYPYETGADQPGHSLTGGSDGSAPILARVLDADVGAIDGRVTATENGVGNLEGRVTAAEGGISDLEDRMTAAEGGINDTADDLADHEDATESVHGITDTADLVYTDDARLSDAREPTAHAATHAEGGSDPLAPADIGAYPAGGGLVDGDVDVAGTVTVQGVSGLEPIRLVGRTTGSGAPVSGDFEAGDVAIDADGVWHLCTASGSPGTWT